ncbi:MAG: DoxX family protein [Polaribacter sp.]|nr:DoxX family protein [Polaribacter sp.]MDG1811509.1 DoxX family protein [Polaribacter sp.]MDG1993238.1 DoxX family protein [Polaribacter sp.]
MKSTKIIFYTSTGLLTLLMLFSAGMYIFDNEEISKAFTSFGFPTYLIYPLAFAKISGLIVLWFCQRRAIVEWAYAGFFFNFILAFFAHYMISDGEQMGALLALVFLVISYIYSEKVK